PVEPASPGDRAGRGLRRDPHRALGARLPPLRARAGVLMSPERVSLGRLWALMATVFVDMVGFLMVLPLLPFYATRLGASPLLVGAMVSAFAVAQLATAPLWGRLSDKRGRRPMLLVGITVSVFAYLLFAFACSETAMARFSAPLLLGLLLFSRL